MKQLNEFNSLADAQAYGYTKEKLIHRDMITSLLSATDSVDTLTEKAGYNINARKFLFAINNGVEEYNLMNSHPVGQAQQALLANLVESESVSANFQAMAIAQANVEVFPYKDTTQEQYNQSNNIYTAKRIEWSQGQDLVIDLEQDINETNATLWLVEDGFQDENLGRPCRLSKSLKYRVRMDGKKGRGTVEVRIPVENTLFNLEVI